MAFTELGVKKIRLTGGEPLVRTEVMTLIQKLGASGSTGTPAYHQWLSIDNLC